jgi:hypothetical protein
MSLIIRNAEAEELAETLAQLTSETKTEALTKALRDRSAQRAILLPLKNRVTSFGCKEYVKASSLYDTNPS